MLKIICSLFAFASLCLAAGPSLAGEIKTYSYPELTMQAPAALTVNKWDFKDNFPTAGCCYIRPKAIATMILSGKLPDQASMQQTMVKLSGVQLKDWKLVNQAQNDKRGWVWRLEYQTFLGDKVVYTVLGHSLNNAYLLMLYADKGDYSAWANSPRAISSVPGTPR